MKPNPTAVASSLVVGVAIGTAQHLSIAPIADLQRFHDLQRPGSILPPFDVSVHVVGPAVTHDPVDPSQLSMLIADENLLAGPRPSAIGHRRSEGLALVNLTMPLEAIADAPGHHRNVEFIAVG